MGGSHTKTWPSPADLKLPETSGWNKVPLIGALLGVAGIGAAAAMGWTSGRFAFAYLTAYMYWLSIALGGLFFVIIQFAARAGWSVLVRRVAENIAATMPLFAILFIPILLNMEHLYHHWLHPDPNDAVLAHKAGYLNKTFFLIRAALYFVTWVGLALFFHSQSTRQDQDGDIRHTSKMQMMSYPAIALFGLSITFAAIDWIKTIDPHWFSTMWGVYYFSGAVLGFFAIFGLLTVLMTREGNDLFHGTVTVEHRHDIGKFTFGFVVFWTYIAFSQYFLIWYASIPEETVWFKHHLAGNWETVGYVLIGGHFILPFLFLMSRHIKRNRTFYTMGAVWLLFMHWVDLYWNIMPMFVPHGAPADYHSHFALSPEDILAFVGVGGLFFAAFAFMLRRQAIVPIRDPRLGESLRFENF